MPITHTLLPYPSCRVECAHFSLPHSPVEEWCLQLHVSQKGGSFEQQLESLLEAWSLFTTEHPQAQAIFTRVFLSDAANQEEACRMAMTHPCGALSLIEQAPLNGTRVSILVYFQSNVECRSLPHGGLIYQKNDCLHLWAASARRHEGDAHAQCQQLFEQYSEQLEQCGGNLYDNAIRTWLFVQNIDVNYAGVVSGRNAHFDEKGLTADTHFISSTGIQGRSEHYSSLVQLDSYSVCGIKPEQIQFLYALDYLNPTHEYGVRFERGTALHLSDRTMCFISGTASIDNKGDVVHIGDIKAQCLRMWENVDALLAEAGASMQDSLQMIVYLRDMADYQLIKSMFEDRFPRIPHVIVFAPVCRPTWLIEMECITLTAKSAKSPAC